MLIKTISMTQKIISQFLLWKRFCKPKRPKGEWFAKPFPNREVNILLLLSLFKILLILLIILPVSCTDVNKETNQKKEAEIMDNSFKSEVTFLKKFTDIVLLSNSKGNAQVAISSSLQGRVMTSTANGEQGRSYGWINHELFESEDTLEHINVFGGEERFWLGPEGGQFSIFHKKGGAFNLDNWYVPRLLDLDPFEIISKTDSKVTFTKSASLENYSGSRFQFDIERSVEILESEQAYQILGITAPGVVQQLTYQTTNTITNIGNEAWDKESGALSIWLLGMFNHSPHTVIIVPFIKGEESELGPIVNDDYFGKVPADRLKVSEGVIYFKGDGEYRSKIGLSPLRAKKFAGSYDYENNILTIIKYSKPEGVTDYVNSFWEIQKEPYKGDVVNSYNDGPSEPGAKPLGPFYELESSSPAAILKSGESITHIQQTYHFEGEEALLNTIALTVLGVSVKEIKAAFKK